MTVSAVSSAKTLNVAVGWSKPPYVIQQGHTGFELDLVRYTFAQLQHDVNFIYIPYGRSASVLKEGEVDAVLTMKENMGVEEGLLSDVYINYQNVAISLKANQITIETISDLKNYAIVAFQNASSNLGEEFKQSTSKSRLYIELPDQKRQVDMLLLGNADIVVMDVNIFNHLSRLSTGKSQMDKVDVHYLFPMTRYRVGFKEREMREQFDQALADVLTSDDYRALLVQYDFLQSLLAKSTQQ